MAQLVAPSVFPLKNKRKKVACKNKSAKYEPSSPLFLTQHYSFDQDPILFSRRRKFWRASQGDREYLSFFGFCGTIEEIVLTFYTSSARDKLIRVIASQMSRTHYDHVNSRRR